MLHIIKQEFTKSSLVLSLSIILVIGALLQILSASFFVDNDNLHIKFLKFMQKTMVVEEMMVETVEEMMVETVEEMMVETVEAMMAM